MIKNKEKQSQKTKGKKALKAILIILAGIAAAAAVIMITNSITCAVNTSFASKAQRVTVENQIVPTEQDGSYVFTTDKEFKILQLTDIHIGGGFMSFAKDRMAMNSIKKLVNDSKPDLVIFTGDMTFPVFKAGTLNNLRPAKELLTLMDSLGVYWTAVPGNHDVEAYNLYSYDKWADLYESEDYKYCLFGRGEPSVDGYGNQIIDIKNSRGEITQSLVLFDSNSYPADNKFKNELNGIYDNIHENQLDWYKAEIGKRSKNGKTVSSLCFFHIPLEEYKTAWEEYKKNNYKDTDTVKILFGKNGEKNEEICCPEKSDNVFETFLELKSTKAVFCGHDHLNNFCADYKGIKLVYGLSIDYLAYANIANKNEQRGGTVITTNPDSSFAVSQLHYEQTK